MYAGISTASLYPLHTEDALRTLAELGTKNVEIFLNTFSEADGAVGADIRKTIEDYKLNVVSLHPFSSPMESVFLFTDYDRRFDDIIGLYRRYFEFMEEIGAKLFVLHGAINSAKCTREHYLAQYSRLSEIAAEYGVTVAQENVSYCRSHSLELLCDIKQTFGEKAAFVLDLKQAIRSHVSPFDIIEKLGNSVRHIHVSDSSDVSDCLPVGAGSFDFSRLLSELAAVGFDGALMVELYRDNYGEYAELAESMKNIERIITFGRY